MYCIQQMVTTGQTSMNHIPLPPPKEPGYSPFYKHPYGGIARDIIVTREGFMRFFDLDDYALSLSEAFVNCGKVEDELCDEHECVGYITKAGHGALAYSITIIQTGHGALMDHAVRTTVPNPQN